MKILLMALTLGVVASAQIVNNGTGTGGSGGGTPPYVVPSFTGSPQTVTAATMLAAGKPQGPDAQAICWFSSSPSVGVSCTTGNSNPAGAGDITFAYGEMPFRVVIATPGSGSQGATGAAGTPGLGCGTLGGVLGGTCAAATLNNTAVTPGSYTSTNLTVGADGRITAASNGTGGAGNGPNLPNYTQNGGGTGATFGGNLTSASPYNLINNGVLALSMSNTCVVATTSGTAGDTFYVSGNPDTGVLQFGYNSGNTYSISGANCTLISSATGYTGEQTFYTITITAGAWPSSVVAGYGGQVAEYVPGTGIGIVKNPTTGTRTVSAISPIVGRSDLTAQSAALTSTALFTPSSTGYYRISYTTKITTPGTSSILGGTTGFVLSYTDGTDSVAQTLTFTASSQAGTILTIGSGNTGNATTTISYGSAVVFALGGVASTYNFGYSSTGTTMVYEIHVRAEAIL